MDMVNYVKHDVVQRHLEFMDLIPAIKRSLQEYSSRESTQPLRTVLWMDKNRRLLVMPSYTKWENTLATKLLNTTPDCAERGLPIRHSYLMLFDTNDGQLKCVMESEAISWMRTAAASVVASQVLVTKIPKVLGLIGTGNSAFSHVLAFKEVYNFEKVKVWSRNPENVVRFCEKLKDFNVTPCRCAEEAVRNADIVVVATSSPTPVLMGKWLKPGCHVNAIGAIKSTWRELDDKCMNEGVIYVDSIEAAQKESGDIILSKAEICAEIGQLLLKMKSPKTGRYTIFKSCGLAIEDAYAAKLVWEKISSEYNT
ncbi:ketimine reductase mu-crystallin-like isoform X2 [Styela clava]